MEFFEEDVEIFVGTVIGEVEFCPEMIVVNVLITHEDRHLHQVIVHLGCGAFPLCFQENPGVVAEHWRQLAAHQNVKGRRY